MDTLEQFIQSNPRPQELKRALAVQMSFITQSNQRYGVGGIEGLKLNYWGTAGYLNAQHKQELVAPLGQKDCWTLEEVMEYIEDQYEVVYQLH